MHKRLSLLLHFITSQTQKQFLSTKKVQQSHIITAITHNHDNHNINKSGYGKITFCIFLSLQYSMVCKKIPNQQTPKSKSEKNKNRIKVGMGTRRVRIGTRRVQIGIRIGTGAGTGTRRRVPILFLNLDLFLCYFVFESGFRLCVVAVFVG
ncbi:hypothetical protein QL285_092803 [Trifolium repens]|nr:hypothetical protein QL285_092803 [Trifolium repens]